MNRFFISFGDFRDAVTMWTVEDEIAEVGKELANAIFETLESDGLVTRIVTVKTKKPTFVSGILIVEQDDAEDCEVRWLAVRNGEPPQRL